MGIYTSADVQGCGLTWVVGTNSGSLEGQQSLFNCWSISPAPYVKSFLTPANSTVKFLLLIYMLCMMVAGMWELQCRVGGQLSEVSSFLPSSWRWRTVPCHPFCRRDRSLEGIGPMYLTQAGFYRLSHSTDSVILMYFCKVNCPLSFISVVIPWIHCLSQIMTTNKHT